MVNNLAAFDHCLSGVEQNRSFFDQCGICTLFFRSIEKKQPNATFSTGKTRFVADLPPKNAESTSGQDR